MIALIAIILCGSICIASCGDDKDEPSGDVLKERLQNYWTFERMRISVMGQTVELTPEELRKETDYNGDFYDDNLSFSGDRVNGLPYEINGNKILLPWYKDLDWWAQVSFDGSRMIMYYNVTNEGVDVEMWITYSSVNNHSNSPQSRSSELSSLLNVAIDLCR